MTDVRRTLRASPSLINVSANFSIVLFLSCILHKDMDFKAENQFTSYAMSVLQSFRKISNFTLLEKQTHGITI